MSGAPQQGSARSTGHGPVPPLPVDASRLELAAFLPDEGRISEMIARGDDLKDVLSQIALLIEAQAPELLTSIMLIDSERQALRHGVAPRLPHDYNRLVDGLQFGEGIGSCGTAVARRQPVYVADTLSDPLWQDFRQVASDFSLRACWSIPLLDDAHHVLGTFAIYRRTPGMPSEQQETLLHAAAQLTRVALMRNRDHVAVRRHEALVRNILDSLGAGVVVIDRHGTVVEVNAAWRALAHQWRIPEPREGFVGLDYFEVCRTSMLSNPETGVRIADHLRAALRNNAQPDDAEYESRVGDHWIQIRPRRLRGDHGGLVIAHIDVTDRRLAEEELRRAYTFRDSIIASAAEGICVCRMIPEEPGIRFSVWNDAMTRLTGYSIEEINRRGWYQTVYATPDERERARQRMDRMRQGVDLESEEWEIRHRNGDPRTVLISTRIIIENEAEPHVLAVMHDISERKQAERRVRDARTFTETLLNSINGLVLSMRSDRKLVRWNRTLEQVLGYTSDELQDIRGEELVVPEDRQHALSSIDEAFQTGSSQGEFTLRARDGREIPFYFSGRTVTVDDEQVLVGVGFDLTERRNAESEIRRLASFPELNPNALLEFDADGQVNYSNRAAARLAESMECGDLASLEPALVRTAVKQCLASGKPVTGIEKEYGGTTLSWAFYPITSQSIVHCYVADVTDRVALEMKYRQATKMESIGRLAGGVAHDFNNLLAALFMQVDNSLAAPQLPAPVRQSLLEIQSTARRAAELTRQLLLFGRQEALRPRDFDLCENVRKTSRMLKLVLGERVPLQLILEPLRHSIRADPGMLDQVLINLAINSRDAMPEGGRFEIRTIERELCEDDVQGEPQAQPGLFVGLRVSDEGSGIRTEHLPRIFEPFFTTKEVGKGTGLGLATVFGIVHQHGGLIHVESQPGHGTTFEVLFPAGTASLHSEPQPAAPPGDLHGNETILLVEDEAAVRRMLQTVLLRFGYHVIAAGHPGEAIQLWAERRDEIAMLVTDLVMPDGMDGAQLAAQFAGDKPDLRIVFTSGYSMDTKKEALELSASRKFVSKPFQVVELMTAIRQALDS